MERYSKRRRFGHILILPFLLLFLCRCGWLLSAWNIHEAAGRGDTDSVIQFHQQGADIDEPSVGVTPLLQALKNRHIETARYLIEQGADVNFLDKVYKTPPIVYAAMYRDLELTRLLIEKGADVNAATGRGAHVKAGVTALVEAAYHGDVEIGRLLLENGADPSLASSTGTTALANARGKGHKTFEELVLSYLPKKPGAQKQSMAALAPEPLTDDDMAYRKAGREDLGGGYILHSTGDPGHIVPAREGGISAARFADENGLTAFKALLVEFAPSGPKTEWAVKTEVSAPPGTESDKKAPDKPAQVVPSAGWIMTTLETTYLKASQDPACPDCVSGTAPLILIRNAVC